ncbi:type II toxin-antitoxin system VapC family toxin [Georgenia sp. 10Sc9-8]|uniref:Type II toxin-antitoxin system VapC family toxin n=1 Tax=Georgenia halotolerans TaxID=3028317 RepID=A0ABT5TWV2_9MICO|nr:type II toxin-antitoxin system VapC family toxin [Georgenia halotolerans]
MTRYVIDAGVAVHLASDAVEVAGEHELLAPTLLRSEVLSLLHGMVVRDELTTDHARTVLGRVRAMRIRLLGDRVLQDVAWQMADRLGWSETFVAEYLALTQLQADAFVTLDAELARSALEVVRTAPIEALLPAPR